MQNDEYIEYKFRDKSSLRKLFIFTKITREKMQDFVVSCFHVVEIEQTKKYRIIVCRLCSVQNIKNGVM